MKSKHIKKKKICLLLDEAFMLCLYEHRLLINTINSFQLSDLMKRKGRESKAKLYKWLCHFLSALEGGPMAVPGPVEVSHCSLSDSASPLSHLTC